MDQEEMAQADHRRKLVESYFIDFTTPHCKEIFLYSSKLFKRIMETGVIDLSDYVQQQKLYLTNPLYNEIYLKGINLLEDCNTPTIFQVFMDYEYDKIALLQQLEPEELTELYLLKTCLYYIRTLDNIEFESLARKALSSSDIELLLQIISELS